jgi:hypothetical protein
MFKSIFAALFVFVGASAFAKENITGKEVVKSVTRILGGTEVLGQQNDFHHTTCKVRLEEEYGQAKIELLGPNGDRGFVMPASLQSMTISLDKKYVYDNSGAVKTFTGKNFDSDDGRTRTLMITKTSSEIAVQIIIVGYEEFQADMACVISR